LKEVVTKVNTNKKEKKININLKRNEYTILDKILAVENNEALKSSFIYIAMILSVSIALAFGSMGYSILEEILKKFNVYSAQMLIELIFLGVLSYLCMIFMGFLAIVCYDNNVFKYGEIAVKVSKYTVLLIIVSMFKNSPIIGVLKELIF
jgi:hypothetical protein